MLVLHILSFGFVLGVTAIADKEAFAWFRGVKRTIDSAVLRSYHVMIWIGFMSLVASGFYLFYPMRFYLLRNLPFDAKLLFVVILFVNAILIGRLMHVAIVKPYAELSLSEKMALMTSGAISVFSWFCAGAIAIYLF